MHGITFSIPNCAEFTVFTTSHVVWFPSVHVNRVEPSVSIVHFLSIKAVEEEVYVTQRKPFPLHSP